MAHVTGHGYSDLVQATAMATTHPGAANSATTLAIHPSTAAIQGLTTTVECLLVLMTSRAMLAQATRPPHRDCHQRRPPPLALLVMEEGCVPTAGLARAMSYCWSCVSWLLLLSSCWKRRPYRHHTCEDTTTGNKMGGKNSYLQQLATGISHAERIGWRDGQTGE
jgi:hypothetical protein